MEEYAYIEILVEDKSRGILVEQVLDKFIKDKQNIAYRIHSFKGIGKIPLKANRVSQIKTKRLLTDLPMYLKGMDSFLKNMPGKKAIFVILDSDDEDCAEMKHRLMQMYQKLGIAIQVFFCIAIEEMENYL